MNAKGVEKYQWSLEQVGQLRAQMIAYRILSHNQRVPIDLIEMCKGKFKSVGHITEPSPVPPKPWPTLQEVQNAHSKDLAPAIVQMPPVRPTTTSILSQQKPGNMTSSVVPVQNSNLSYHNTLTQYIPKFNPVKTLHERENRIANQIALRIQELNNLPTNMPLDMRNKAQAELKKLQLINLQREIKKQGIFSAVLQNGKYLREMFSKNLAKVAKINKAILVYHANLEKERRKERERIEKERMKRLMEEDEEGYRVLIDQKKDRRLAFLLAQTDEYISRLSEMVKQHKMGVKIQLTGKKKGPKALNSVGDSVAEKETAMSEINIDEAQKLIKDAKFEDDEYKTTENVKSYYSIAHSVTEVVTEQAAILVNGKLKEYQIKGLEWLVSLYNNNLNGILADDMGLGKTIQTIALITYLMEKKNVTGPYLIIVPLSTLSNWLLEFKKWAPTVNVLAYKGSIEERYQTQTEMISATFNVLITTFELITRDRTVLSKICWKYMIIDEGHRMKNHHCKLTLTLNKYYRASHRLLLTGTPLQNKLPELWSLLNFLLPSIFKSCATFEDWFNAPFAITGAKVELNEEETILIIRRLHKVLRPFLLRRLKKEVESQLPGKVEHVIKCNMSSLQRILYRNMQSKGYIQTGSSSESGGVRAMMNSLMQLRKICNHPFLFHQVEEEYYNHVNSGRFVSGPELYRVAGKFELLDRILPKLKATNHRVLLFCQMTKLMNIMEDYLKWREFKYLRLDGTTKANTRGELLRNFNKPESDVFLFLLSTRAGGLGLNLQSADTVILFDSDWNPHQDLQAQDRAHRIGQQHKVLVIRLLILNSVEERILAAAKYKLNIDEKVIQAGMFNQKSTGSERQEFLKSILHQDGEDEDEEEVPNDDSINKMIARSPEELSAFHKMDIERKNQESNSGCKPRLLEESELPTSITKVEMLNDEQQENPEDSKGLRKRRKVMYRDTITEEEWFEAVGDFDDEWDPENVKQNVQRKRGRPRKGSLTTADTNESDDTSTKNPRKTSTKHKKTITMQNKLMSLMDRVIKYTAEDGRVLSDAFMKLPLRKEIPDYYKAIKEPMDIKKINLKITSGKINSVDHLESYFMLMCKNAQTFYDASTVFHTDSIKLQKIFGDLKSEFETEDNSEAACENRDQPLKIKIKIKKRRSSN